MTADALIAELLSALRALRQAVTQPDADMHSDHVRLLIDRADHAIAMAVRSA
jgi:hypothetical protein